ncbi:MAG: UTP--glucose-1-phosphate uridylyltransferase GalU [Bdellovibrionales bacterium]|nr:UTP--glucose-1-phosphate uridylyltransferase GalU [Bdellovibrionales bacterium]
MQKITKAVIPAAGLGTRFLPVTKSVPKEMLPLVDKPILLYVVEEAVAAGIEDIIIIAGRGKTAIENFFDTNFELENLLVQTGQEELLQQIKDVSNMANIISIRQKEAKGLGHAIHCAKPIIGMESFAVLLGDEITFPQNDFKHVTAELIDIYQTHNQSCVSVMEVAPERVEKYGVIAYKPYEKKHKGLPILQVNNIIEKPTPAEAPSQLALPGRYVFTADIFSRIEQTPVGKNNELQLTDAMVKMLQHQPLLAINIPNRRYDAGDKLGFLMANIDLALERNDMKESLKDYLRKLQL